MARPRRPPAAAPALPWRGWPAAPAAPPPAAPRLRWKEGSALQAWEQGGRQPSAQPHTHQLPGVPRPASLPARRRCLLQLTLLALAGLLALLLVGLGSLRLGLLHRLLQGGWGGAPRKHQQPSRHCLHLATAAPALPPRHRVCSNQSACPPAHPHPPSFKPHPPAACGRPPPSRGWPARSSGTRRCRPVGAGWRVGWVFVLGKNWAVHGGWEEGRSRAGHDGCVSHAWARTQPGMAALHAARSAGVLSQRSLVESTPPTRQPSCPQLPLQLTLQVGQGFCTLRTRSERPVAAPASISSAMPPYFFSRQGLQKLWPAGRSGKAARASFAPGGRALHASSSA